MKRIKVSEATPIQLDWLVAKCAPSKFGPPTYRLWQHDKGAWIYLNASMEQQGIHFRPSIEWAQGGPIVEKELINLITTAGYPWRATMYMGGGVWIDQHGPTPLIAAMRCYVCSVMGEIAEIPEELE